MDGARSSHEYENERNEQPSARANLEITSALMWRCAVAGDDRSHV